MNYEIEAGHSHVVIGSIRHGYEVPFRETPVGDMARKFRECQKCGYNAIVTTRGMNGIHGATTDVLAVCTKNREEIKNPFRYLEGVVAGPEGAKMRRWNRIAAEIIDEGRSI